MEETKIENPDSLNEEQELENGSENHEESSEDVSVLKAKNQSLYEQLKKAKGFERDESGKWVKKEQPKPEVQPEKKPEAKSDGLGYGEKAYLLQSGIRESEFELVQKTMKENNKTLEQVINNPFFKSELEIARTKEATPTGKRSGSLPTDSVEYWMAKPIEEVPQEMRLKVVNAKLKGQESKGAFYNS